MIYIYIYEKVNFSADDQELTGEELNNLSRRISSEEDLQKFAFHLGMTIEMEEYLKKDRDTTFAARHLLLLWCHTQSDRKSARVKLYETIKNTEMAGLLTEIL